VKIEGCTIWVVGASSGIGAALAPRLAAKGSWLVLSARREEELSKVAAGCSGEVLVKPLDVTDLSAIRTTYEEAVSHFGRIDALIYGAGAWNLAKVTEFDVQKAVNELNVNLLGLVRTVGTVMPDMIARRSGTIAGIASVAGYAGLPRAAGYSASKAGELAFLQSIRMELKAYDVEVLTVSPGFVKTPLTDKNTFPMPFIMDVGDAADTIIKGLQAGTEEIHFPKRLSIPFKLFSALPRPVFEAIARRIMAR
jgi:short-subunit dehydrogenase